MNLEPLRKRVRQYLDQRSPRMFIGWLSAFTSQRSTTEQPMRSGHASWTNCMKLADTLQLDATMLQKSTSRLWTSLTWRSQLTEGSLRNT
ncbi:CDC16 cell division cycle 16 homolog (S. cerevisiae), isoform CRA_d [Mus musculus]|nr:CDC16 cell division cycle 16 homolog (S. cerevisiae), isoform CRA_d [Mus musculus]